jgi:hypothetical protein
LDHAYAIRVDSVLKTPTFFICGNHQGNLVSPPDKFTGDYAGPIGCAPPSMMNNQKNAHLQLSFTRGINGTGPDGTPRRAAFWKLGLRRLPIWFANISERHLRRKRWASHTVGVTVLPGSQRDMAVDVNFGGVFA